MIYIVGMMSMTQSCTAPGASSTLQRQQLLNNTAKHAMLSASAMQVKARPVVTNTLCSHVSRNCAQLSANAVAAVSGAFMKAQE
jgi:hypothetical protein